MLDPVFMRVCPSMQDGSTPLDYAARKNQVEVAKALISIGANKYVKDKVRTVLLSKDAASSGEHQPG